MPTDESKKEARLHASRAWTWRFVHRCVKPGFARKQKYSYDELALDGPFLLVANHANNADPIFIGAVSPKTPLAYVSSDHLNRLGIAAKLLERGFYRISRSKASAGTNTVRAALRTLRSGKPVVLFAEGDCTWDGVSAPVFPATGKLAKASHVPLVTYRLEGNYLAKPRWAVKARKAEVRGRLVHIYTPQELSEMTGEQVTQAINSDIFVDVWQNQREHPVELKCSAPAKGLEKMLFGCPGCGRIGSLKTGADFIRCPACGYEDKPDKYGFFTGGRFSTLREWDQWQHEKLRELLENGADAEEGPLFSTQAVLTPLEGSLDGEPGKAASGGKKQRIRLSLRLSTPAMVIQTGSTERRVPLSDISDMAMVKTNRLLFSTRNGYFEIFTKRGILRPYLSAWQLVPRNAEDQ